MSRGDTLGRRVLLAEALPFVTVIATHLMSRSFFHEFPWFCLSCKYTSPYWRGAESFKYCTRCQSRMQRLEAALRRVDWVLENMAEANSYYQDRAERQRLWAEDYGLVTGPSPWDKRRR